MADVVPGATYYDGTVGEEFLCNGTVTENGIEYVVIEYMDIDDTVRVPAKLFVTDSTIELTELP